jgi:NAD(P)-dependent dehydrogenase (short-subunit alcohol dehydrogenase family)
MDLGLQGKVVIITGSSDGLGAAAARTLSSEGASVVICARNLEKLQTVAAGIGQNVLAVQTDVTKPEHLEHLVARTMERFGRIDALVNNAGRAAALPFEKIDDAAWHDDLELKFYAAIRLSRLVVPYLRAAGGGSILNILATGGKTPAASSMPSSVSRAAGMALMKAMSKDLGTDNIRVNAVLIGLVESDQWVRRSQTTGVPLEQIYANLPREGGIPLGRVGRSQEFADFIAFLVSQRAAYLSGCAINFDGGMSTAV